MKNNAKVCAIVCQTMQKYDKCWDIKNYSKNIHKYATEGGLTNADNTEKNTLQGANKFLPFKMLSSNICNFGIFF